MKYVIVDDNPGDRRLLQIHLESISHLKKNEYILLSSLSEFAAYFKENSRCDVVFLDLGLPDSSGIATVETAVSIVDTVPIIVLTGLNDIVVGEGALRAGASDYLVKDSITTALLEKTILFAIERNNNRTILRHHTAFLEALRNIDRKMQEHVETEEIFEYICGSLKGVGVYEAIWIFHQDSKQVEAAAKGDCAFTKLEGEPEKAAHTCHIAMYIEDELKHRDMIVESDYHNTCDACPLGLDHGMSGYLALPLKSNNEIYGNIVIIGSSTLIQLRSEQLLFQELAKSISQMLYTREMHRRAEELDQLRNRLHEFERLETLGRIAGGMAHDFNNQLTSILGNSEFLHYELKDRPELLECVDEIINAVETSTELARDVLHFSGTHNRTLDECNLLQVIEDTTKLIRSTLPKTVHLQVQYNIEESMILGRATKIENALLNLALNAADAMEQMGDLIITVEYEGIPHGHPLCELFDIQPGPYIAISVADSGSGIPEKLKDNIFSPFFTTKGADKGTGLGLPSVLSMVREHNGALEFNSQEGEGTTFTIYLPKSDVAVQTASIKKEVLIQGSGTILFVDDERSVRETVSKLLMRLGYTITAFESAGDALEALEQSPTLYDLVISDYDMPDMNGIEFLTLFEKMQPQAKAILATGHNIVAMGQLFSKAPLELKTVQKPFRIAQLSRVISELLQ